MSILFKGNLEEGNYTLIKSTDGWVLKGETSYVGFNFADRKTEPITHDDYIETENDHLEAKCLNCNNAKACKEKHWEGCVYEPQMDKCDYCIFYDGEICYCQEHCDSCKVKTEQTERSESDDDKRRNTA